VEIEEAVRSLWGLLSLFSYIDVDFESVRTDWIPETEAEQEQITVNGFSMTRDMAAVLRPRRLNFDLVARALLSAKAATHYETPLGFLRRGMRAIHARQYIEAFNNLFYFLETLYAPGYSNPKQVKRKLWSAKDIRAAVAKAREPLRRDNHLDPRKKATLLGKSDEELVTHLVETRGELHHHSLRKSGVWHPDKADQFQEEAILLQHTVHSIAMQRALSIMYAPERDRELMLSAREAGAITIVRIEAIGLVKGVKTSLVPFVIEVPRRKLDREALNEVHLMFRNQFRSGPRDVQVFEYQIVSGDGSKVYAVWRSAETDASSASQSC
jgi:hypothetical protein